MPIFFWQPVITTKKLKTVDEQRWERDYTHDPARADRLYQAIIDERRHCRELIEASDAVDLSALFDDWSAPYTSTFIIFRKSAMARWRPQCCPWSRRRSAQSRPKAPHQHKGDNRWNGGS